MLPTSGYFRGIPCPDHQQNNCHRPYCHFHHGARKEQPSTSSSTSSISKQDVDWREYIAAEEHSNASYSSTTCEDEVPEESAGGASGVDQSDLLQQLVSEAVKKVLEENPGLASSTDTSLVMKSINTSALVAQATAAAVIPTATKKKKVYLRPPDTPSYNPTPIKELKKRKLSTEASFDYSTPGPKVVKYTPTPILTLSAATSDSQKEQNNKESVDSEVTDFSSEESDAEINKRNCDFDLLEEVLAEHSQNNKVKVKKKRVKALGKLKYNLSVLEKKVDKSVMISDAKNLPDTKLTTCIQPNKTPPREAPAEESYFLPPSPVFTSSSSVVNEVLNSIVYVKSSTMPAESEIAENVVCHEKTVQNVKESSDKKDSTDTVTCSTSTIYTEKQPVSSEAKTKSTCLTSTLNTEKKPVSSETKKKSKGHTHLPQVVHTLVAPKLSRPSVRSWTPQVRSASSETKKDEYPLDEILQIMDGGDDPKITEPPVKSSSVHEQKENIKSKKKYKVDLDKEIESLTKPSSVKGSGGKKEDQTDSENISKSTKGKTRTLSSDEPKAADDLESKNGDTDDEKSESSNTQEEGGKSDACSTESDDKDDIHNEEGNTDSDQEKEKHKKSKKRHRSSSESDHSRHRKRHKKNRKRRHKHSRSKKRKRHRHSTSGSEDSQEDAEETDQNTDVSDESNEEDKASTEKPSKHKKHKKYKHRKKSKYKKKKNKYKGKKKSKSYSSSRSSSRSRSVNTSRRNSRSSSEDSSRRLRSKEISNNSGKNSSRDSSEESRSRSSSKEHKRRSRKRKSLSKERSKDSNDERDSSSEERSRSSSKENTKNSSRERRKSISKERKESTSKERKESTNKERKEKRESTSRERKESTNKERKEKLRKEKRESTSRERRECTSKGSRERKSKEKRDSSSRERRESTNKGSRERKSKEKRDSSSRERRESTNKGSRERKSKEKRDSTSRDRRESLSKDRRDSHKEGSSKNSTKEKSKNSSKETIIEGPASHKGRSSSKDKDSSSGRDKKESRDKDKEGAKKKESRSRSISDSHHQREGDDKSLEHTDPPVSIPMPIDPSTIKQEKDVLVPDLSLVKTEKVDKGESSRVSSLLSEKSVPKKSVSETGNKQGSNIKSNLECKSKSESSSHRRKKSTDSISDKSSHGRLSTDSRNSDNEALNERSQSSPEPQPRRLSMFDEIMASTVPKSKGLTEISMFDSAESSSGKLKSHKTYSSNVKSKRRSSGSVDSRSNINSENSGDVGDSGTVGQDKEPPSDIIQHSNSSSSGQSSKQQHNSKHSSSSNKHSSSSKHSSKHSSSNKHISSTSKHVSSSSSSSKHGSSSSKHDSSGNKHGGGSSSSKHSSGSKQSSNSSSSIHKQSSRSEGKHKSSKVAGHSTPRSSGAATGTAGLTPSGRSTVDTGTSSGISERDSFDFNGNESPLPDFSELDEIPHDDWEQIINSSNTPESHQKENPDSDLDSYELDHENPDVMEECMRMFDEFQPDPSRPDTQVSTRKQKCDSQTVEPELVTGKKRIARTSSTGNLIPKKPTYLQKVKQTPMQKMMERFNELKEINAELEKRLKQPQEVQGESSAVSSSTSSASIAPASSSTHITSPPGKKRRISHVPNVSSLLNAREKIKSLPPTSSRNLLSAKISKASGSIPRTSTIAQTMVKGGKRVAHVPKTEVLTRPIVPAEFGSKVPQNIRQRYLNTLIDECLKFCTEREAFNIGVAEERVCFQRSSSRMVYLSLAVNAVKRLRSQQMVGDAAQELIENEPQLFESSSKDEPSPPPQASTSSVSSTSKTSKTSGKPHPINPNHVKLSHYSVLTGGGLKGSWSIEKPKKNTQTMGRLKDEALYKHLNRYVLSEELLGENGYPYPDPDEKGKAIVKTIDRRKKLSPSCTERYCDRCSLLYYVDKWGFPVTTTSCCYHWGRSYKRRTYVGFESRHSCCDGDLQSGGCCLATTHVSQNYNPKKLRGYVRTIPKDVQGSDAGVYALDCEMSYTTGGCELTRVTVINSGGTVVYEQFVKPENPIIDYNTRFSGITESDMEDVQTSLRDVQASLLARFSEKTILIGHSLESDLHALKIIHDTVVDTSVVFPHKMGPPAKRALRNLASEYLKRIIQNDVSGHDSAEDAITCMDLMHWKIKEDQKGLK